MKTFPFSRFETNEKILYSRDNFAHKDIPQEAECVTPPQSHRESLGGIGMDRMYVTRQVILIEPGHFLSFLQRKCEANGDSIR